MVSNEIAEQVRKQKRFSWYFRYPLHSKDFSELREDGKLLGYYTSKPLYGKLTAGGRVDRSAGYSGKIAVIFIPSPVRSAAKAILLLTRVEPSIVSINGKRNWKVIRQAAEQTIIAHLREAA